MRGACQWVSCPLFIWFKTMEREQIEAHIRNIAEETAAKKGLELVHVELAGTKKSFTARIYIDKEGGVTVEDCAQVSREVEAVMDADDLIQNSYLLEVSSPGIERGLYSIADFTRFAGENARIKLRSPLSGQKNFRGTILSVNGDSIAFDDRTAGEVSIAFENVSKANLEIDLDQELKRR